MATSARNQGNRQGHSGPESNDPPKLDDSTGSGEGDEEVQEESSGDKYIVVHAAVNVWDSEFDLKDAKKDRLVRRLRKGDVVTAEDLKHADIERLVSLGSIKKQTKDDTGIDPNLGGFRVDGEE